MKTTYRSIIIGLLAIMTLLLMDVTGVKAQTTGKGESRYSNLVIFVSFSDSDDTFMQTQADPNIYGDLSDVDRIQKYYNDESYKKSLVSFVRSISYGQLTIDSYLPQLQNGVITPIKLSKTKASYGDNSYAVQKEAIDLFNISYRDMLTQYNLDENNDGCVDNVTFIFEGADDNRAGAFYSHKEDYNGNETLNGLRVGTVNVQNEESVLYDPTLSEGVLCHEYLHSLGFPDLYKNGDTTATPVGRWDIMAGTSPFLQFPLAYMRSTEYLGTNGWLTIDTITKDSLPENGVVTLDSASSADGNQAYILKSPLNDSEFFVIEYRKQGEQYSDQLEVKIPGTGLIVYRINTKVERLSNHYGDTDGVYVFRDNQTSVTAGDNMSLDQSFYSAECGRTSIGSLDLNATISDGALVFSDGTNSGIQISDIGNAGDTISCKITYADTDNVELWETLGNQNISNDSSSMISSDTDSKGQVYVAHSVNGNQMQISTYTDDTGWTTVGNNISEYSMNGVLRIFNDVPYVLFSDNTQAMNMVLYEYSASQNQWKKVATVPSTTGGYIQAFSMETGNDGLYVAYEDGNYDGYTIKLGKYSAGKWSVIQDNIAKLQGSYPDISIGTDEKIYIAMRDYGKNKPIVYCYDGKTVSTVGDLSSVACGSRAKMVSGDGVLYLLADDTAGMKVFQYTSDDGWTLVGDGALTNKQSSTSDICLMDGCPIVQLVNQDAGKNNTQVFRYRAGSWQQEGNTIDTAITTEAELTVFEKTVYLSYLITSGNSDYPFVKWRELDIKAEDKPVTPPVDPTNPDPSEPTEPEPPKDVKVTSIVLSDTNKTLLNGDFVNLSVSVLPDDAMNKEVTWTSSNDGVAVVTNGKVTAKSVGEATITVTAVDGSGVSATCKVKVNQKYETITEGIYTISNKMNLNQVLDISGGSGNNGANLQTYMANFSGAQQYQFKLMSDGYYKIIVVGSGKVLDVSGGSTANGANVQQWVWNGSNAQLWRIYKNADESYMFQSKLGKVLDVSGGNSRNGANVQLYTSNGTNAQKWYFNKRVDMELHDKTYSIASKLNSKQVLDISGGSKNTGANLQLYASNGTGAQKYKFTSVGNGYYKVLCSGSGKAMDVSGGSSAAGANVQQWTWNGTIAQQWRVFKMSDGAYVIQSRLGNVLDVSGGRSSNGTNVQVWSYNASNAQKWNMK